MYNTHSIGRIKDILLKQRETVAVAESVTSGHLQAAISLAQRASEFFQGGITTYNLNQKNRHLHVDPVHALSCNCVSKQVAEEMAANTVALFQCDWAIAITGYATPMPEMGIDHLFAFWSIAYKGQVIQSSLISAQQDDPIKVQAFYTNTILQSFADILEHYD